MKRIFVFSAIAVAALATFASCQKDPAAVEVPESTVYLTTGTATANEVNYVVNYDALTGAVSTVGATSFSVKLASTEPAGADITVNLKVDASLVASPWTLLPEAAYTISATTLTLAKDASESEAITVTLNPETVTEFGSYLLPLTVEVTEGKAVLSTTAAVVNVKFAYNRLNGDIVPEGWSKLGNGTDFTVASYPGFEGFSDEGWELDNAFDGDVNTEWYSYSGYYDSEAGDYVYAEDYSAYYGCFAEVKFNEPTDLKGLIVSMNTDSQYYFYRARRLSVMFQYEGDEDYTWDKTYGYGAEYGDETADEAYYTFCPMLGSSNNIAEIPGYAPSPADFLINEASYSNYAIDLTAKLEGKKVVGMIILPACLYVYQNGWNDELQDFNYTYYYDAYFGTIVGEISVFN
ncbi:MAG: DUF1735 domain-containing protein [Candidatus Cryptobacteroides sp.]